jgi:hypothetical protein
MKTGTRSGFWPKTTVLGCSVGWLPDVAAGCHGVAAYQAARPGRRGGPQCAMGRGHHGRSQRGGMGGHGSLGTGLSVRALGRWEGCVG